MIFFEQYGGGANFGGDQLVLGAAINLELGERGRLDFDSSDGSSWWARFRGEQQYTVD